MKNIASFIFVFCVTIASFAQVPQSFGFQTVVHGAGGIVANANVGARLTILRGSATGASVYCETQDVYTSANGVASFEVGKGTVVSGTFADIQWLSSRFFLKAEIDPAGGTSYTISQTVELSSVPYAMLSGLSRSYTKIDSLMSLFANRLRSTDSIMAISIDSLRLIDSLILIRIVSDSVFDNGIGRFATSDTTFITFAPGNLWYRPSDTMWKIPDHQWDTAGQVSNSQLGAGYAGWVDMVAWGTSGMNGILPSDTTNTGSYYGDGLNNLNGTPYDWPYLNAIHFGHQIFTPNTWRTPTDAEWTFIMSDRSNAANLRALATVNGINGLVLLPDDWPGMPLGCHWQPSADNWGVNSYNGVFWTAMECQGAVFLPASGYLHRARPYHCHDQGMQGFYWSETSAPTNVSNCYYMYFGILYTVGGLRNVMFVPSSLCGREYNHSVRLVKDLPRDE